MGAAPSLCCCSPDSHLDEQPAPTEPIPRRKTLLNRLRFEIVGARNLRNADFSLPGFNNKSDPYCVAEIRGRPLSRFITDVIKDNLNPVWKAEGTFADYHEGEGIVFKIYDKDDYKRDDFLGSATLESATFWPGGYTGELQLDHAGTWLHHRVAFIEVVIQAKPGDEEANNALHDKISAGTGTQSMKSIKQSGNKNIPLLYIWLEAPLANLAGNTAAGLGCKNADEKAVTPIFFIIGACPNVLCGSMQAVMFSADKERKVHFWWVKPKSGEEEVETATLCENGKGPHKNDPGRSRPFLQPLAELFESKAAVGGWHFGLDHVTLSSGSSVTRAYVQQAIEGAQRLYLHIFWQEDWTSCPLAYHRYIKGKLVYQKDPEKLEFWLRQYQIDDGHAHIAEFEEGPIETILPGKILPDNTVKVLYDVEMH